MWKKIKEWFNNIEQYMDQYEEKQVLLKDAWVYSKLIKRFPLCGKITDDDILHISHKSDSGDFETCFITIAQLKEALKNS
jgi:hypothetical protein